VRKFIVILMVISLMVFLSGSIFAQGAFGINEVNQNPSGIDAKLVTQAGHQLESYASQYYTGFWLQVVGYVFVALGINSTTYYYSSTSSLSALGALFVLAGGLMQFLAAGNIGSAGASLVLASSGQ